ncbi:helix-turn-helix transcriptional regulator [Streptomyces sp. NPDC048650]|uniref:helix-turn-helix transcriptional regulator n=1 Tax=unclassified Streptomyces TaxID=2593676 RepID=UPI003718E416
MPESAPPPSDASAGREELTPLELMGLAGLLRAWRAAAGEKRGLGRPLTQKEVAQAIGRSVRWYIDLEGGATPRLERCILDALTRELMLGPDQETTLHLYALGGAVTTTSPALSAEAATLLQLLLDQQMPSPAYISNLSWDIIGYNTAMAEWYPWVRERGANLMRWTLRSREARRQFINWEHHAAIYLEQLRFALAEHPHNPELQKLLAYIVQDPDCERLWHASTEVRRSGEGRHFFQALPRHDYEIIHVVSNVLYPAGLPNSRLVVITWLKEECEPQAARDATLKAPYRSQAASGSAHRQHPTAGPGLLGSAQEAAELAGPGAVPLPVMSRLAGPLRQLTFSPEKNTVVWAEQQDDGCWTFQELDPYTVLKRLPRSTTPIEAPEEYKRLVRALVPSDPKEAAERIDVLLLDYLARLRHLAEMRRELSEQHSVKVSHTELLGAALKHPDIVKLLKGSAC